MPNLIDFCNTELKTNIDAEEDITEVACSFLHIDDNHGLDKLVRLEMNNVFPSLDFVEVPFDHQKYDFDQGLPNIHEHYGNSAQCLGIIFKGRLVCYYGYETDLGNSWEDQ
jgi:hypothetical protein